jgi:plasmid stabilization system protein ParE
MSLVYTTDEADAMIATASDWWAANRPKAPGLLLDELGAAKERLERFPEAGRIMRRRGFPGLRRVILPRTRYHVYYRYFPERDEVWVVAVWAAVRGRGPRLPAP